MQVNLVPVAANPKDFRSIAERMKALATETHKNYSEFAITDQISLSPSQREAYALGLNGIENIRQEAKSYKIFDNLGLKSTSGFYDRNTEVNEISGICGDGSRLEISYDASGSVTSYSELQDPQKTTGPDRLFQENNQALVFSVCQRSGAVDGILFDKTTHQGTIFKVE